MVVVVLLIALGCGGESHTDAGAGPGSEAAVLDRCAALEAALLAAIATHGTCETAADCQRVAGPASLACDGEPYMIDCGGVPVERNAPGRERAETLTHEFFDTHCDAGRTGAFDCAPQVLHCNADHHCTGTTNSCLPPPPADAGAEAGVTPEPGP